MGEGKREEGNMYGRMLFFVPVVAFVVYGFLSIGHLVR